MRFLLYLLMCTFLLATHYFVGCDTTPTQEKPGTQEKPRTQEKPGITDASVQPEKQVKPELAQEQKPVDSGCGKAESSITFSAQDGIQLAADYWPAQTANRGVVILLHMIPPTYNRTSYPERVRKAIHDLNLNVFNIDRRGAGASKGKAQDAYQGPSGALDLEKAFAYLADTTQHNCAVNLKNVTLMGASNGTTSALDYTVKNGVQRPASLIWLSPGAYTENQNKIQDNLNILNALPVLTIHPASEPWIKQNTPAGATQWKVVELANGKHGTNNFDKTANETQQTKEIIDWLKIHHP